MRFDNKKILVVNTGLKDYLMPDKISLFSDKFLITEKYFQDKPEHFLLLETFAQTATYHQRRLHNFEKHHFLLSIDSFNFDEELPENRNYTVKAELLNQSESVGVYKVMTSLNGKEITGLLKIASSDKINKINQKYYKKVFECLQKKQRNASDY
ncbi:MAG: hypothetical protein CSB55_05575 [Candidatus Cloacimonadota bacterium]|nr:MAG: hypothetical protein CSB55_05575 [Candidatus Cloacimonadota bacterium]